jgi:peroxiredoxin Q/BCP
LLAVSAVVATAAAAVPAWAQKTFTISTKSSSAPAKAAPTFGGPNVGDVAPDFALPAASRFGLLRDSVKLSDFRGQTVVLAFFPGARTPGCTIQMEKYRDEYATLFPGSKVVVIGISVDADTTLANWAHDDHLPMLFMSDKHGVAGSAYGAYSERFKLENRLLYVVGPDGKITYTVKPFNVSTPASYTALGDAVKKTL